MSLEGRQKRIHIDFLFLEEECEQNRHVKSLLLRFPPEPLAFRAPSHTHSRLEGSSFAALPSA